jgi:hypothetical protein
VSARAWILFFGLGSLVTAGAWAATATAATHATPPVTVTDARITVDLETQVCRLLLLGADASSPAPAKPSAALRR